jgi:ThiF family/Prokaryotic E2 family A/Prokaryotic homologs of the JAB domain
MQELAAASGGAIQLVSVRDDDGRLILDVSIATHGITTSGGIAVRRRERFEILVSEDFPFTPPSVWVAHRRWAGTPHVQWGRYLCIYAASAVEWNPGDGMRGLVDRLLTWLEHAASGTLDPDGQPLHPPVIYSKARAGSLVVHPDLGDRVPWNDTVTPGQTKLLYGWCDRTENRIDVRAWMTLPEIIDLVLSDDFTSMTFTGTPYFVSPVLLISDELTIEYPRKGSALVASLAEFGCSREELLRAVTTACTVNNVIAAFAGVDNTAPVVLMVGTPTRRTQGSRRLAHLAGWKFDDIGTDIMQLLRSADNLRSDALSGELQARADELSEEIRTLANNWVDGADVAWMAVHENRAEVTNRRDAGTPATWLQGKRVLVLGCGALGAPIAEQSARAGVSTLTVVDDGTVKPGILVRQPYQDSDIGQSKAEQLAARLRGIDPNVSVEALKCDAIDLFVGQQTAVPQYDLVVDATAHIGVRAAIETARAAHRDKWPPVITGLFGHDALRALGIVSPTGATGCAHDILRRIAIDAHRDVNGTLVDIANDFFPEPPRTAMFFPEPGCSAPTFTGSAIQTTALASMLFWSSITALAGPAEEGTAAVAIRLAGIDAASTGAHWWHWPNDHVVTDVSKRYEVRLSARAIAEMRAETRRGNRTRGRDVETGGMLLGGFDDAVGCVYIDGAVGPSPDSALSDRFFAHGTDGTQGVVERFRDQTINRVGFVGMWHTHPYGPARPSAIDEGGMGWIVSPSGTGRRALMLILGGPADRWDRWRGEGQLPDVYVRVVERDDPMQLVAAGGERIDPTVVGTSFPGGFFQPDPPTKPPSVAPWWRRALRLEP